MDIGLNLPVVNPATSPAVLRGLARAADDLGFAELYLGEHVVLFDRQADAYPGGDGDVPFPPDTQLPDPLVAHAFLAAATERIRLATGVLLLAQRNPVYTAKHIATLDWLSGGRIDIAIGLGWSRLEYEACGVPFERRGARTDEYVDVMKALWHDGSSEHRGPLWNLEPCQQYPKPAQSPHPPLWFGGMSDAALKRVAARGDGWYGFNLGPDKLAERVHVLDEMLTERGRTLAEVSIVMGTAWRDPPRSETVDRYRVAGLQQLVVSLTATEPDGMVEEMRALAGRLITAAAETP